MVDYNPKDWFRYIFYFQKADTARKLAPLILIIGAYAAVLAYFMLIYWGIGDDTDLRNISLMHTLLGFVISLLLVFRTNTAYDRWWEGRKQWGALVNSSRNLSIKMNGLLSQDYTDDRTFYREMIPNYAFSLKNHLRGKYQPEDFGKSPIFNLDSLVPIEHVPNQIASAIFNRTMELQRKGILSPEEVLLLKSELESFTDICGACERIKNTPIPLSYSSFIKKFIFTYSLTLPIGYVFSLHFLVVPFVMFVFYILASLEVIAEEIEDPFGDDANDLPIEKICQGIYTSSHALIK